MSEAQITPRRAWLPLSPRGVAAFAAAGAGRLWLVQLVGAALVAAMTVWFVQTWWFSVVREAVRRLPAGAAVRAGVLHWPAGSPTRLAENRFLALVVDMPDTGELGRTADVELALHERRCTVSSLLGFVEWPYPRGWTVSLNPAEAVPWWGAWEWPLLALLAAAVVIGLFLSWTALATLYCPFVKACAFLANHRLSWLGSWKLGGAALLPGALVMIAGIFLYGWLGLDLIRLGFFFLLHLVTGWIYLAASPFFLPKEASSPAAGNPFAPPVRLEKPARSGPNNPFATPR